MIRAQTTGRRTNPYPHHEVGSLRRSSTEKFSFLVARPPPERLIKLRPTIRRPTVGAPMPQCRPPGMAWEQSRLGSASMSSQGDLRPAALPRLVTRSSPRSAAPRRGHRLPAVSAATFARADATRTCPAILSCTHQLSPRAGPQGCASTDGCVGTGLQAPGLSSRDERVAWPWLTDMHSRRITLAKGERNALG
jgi:hypothetical protein